MSGDALSLTARIDRRKPSRPLRLSALEARECLREREPPGRAARSRRRRPRSPAPARGARSSIDEIPPAAITGSPASRPRRAADRSGPASEPSRPCSSRAAAAHRPARSSAASAAAVVPEPRVQPSTATSPSRTSIATTRRVAEAASRLSEEGGGEGGRADHDPIGARGERRRDRIERAVPTADLEWKPAGRRDPLDELERRRAAERAVEVDEVEAARTLVAEPAGELDGIAPLDRDRLASALRKPHDPSLEHVDRGKNIESRFP